MIINVLHLGFGRVGKELICQLANFEEVFESQLGVSLKFVGTFKSNSQIVEEGGLSAKQILNKSNGEFLPGNNFLRVLKNMQAPLIVIDTTGSEKTYPWLIKSLKSGGLIVMSNKKPLTDKLKKYQELMRLSGNKIFFETVVGAGLPIIKTVKEMLLTGDEIFEIHGAFSGTLGFIFSQLQNGRRFSEIVRDAMNKGFTEPDPRDDLSGTDVARKALILSRLLGSKREMSDISLSGMVPKNMANLTLSEFLKKLPSLDNFYARRVKSALAKGKTLRFVVKVSKEKTFARLQEVNLESDVGNLKGPDNIVIIKSKRYFKNPLVIKGPGAGIEVTAAGVFADILEAVRTIKQKKEHSMQPLHPYLAL